MSQAKVKSALVKVLVDSLLFDAAHLALENRPFTQPSGPWASIFFIPAQPAVSSLGLTGTDRFDGLIQIDTNYPLNSGDGVQGDMCESIRALYKPGSKFVYSGQAVTITSCGRSGGRTINGFFRISMSVGFYSQLTR